MRTLQFHSVALIVLLTAACSQHGNTVGERPAPAGGAAQDEDVGVAPSTDSVTIVVRAQRGVGTAKIYVVYRQGPRYLLGGSSGIRLGEVTTVSIPWHPGGFAFLTSVPVQSASAIGQTENRLSREVELNPGDVYTVRYPEYFIVGGFLYRPE